MKAESRIYRVKPRKLARVAVSMAHSAPIKDLYQWCCGFPSHARIHSAVVIDDELVITVSWGRKDGRLGLISSGGAD